MHLLSHSCDAQKNSNEDSEKTSNKAQKFTMKKTRCKKNLRFFREQYSSCHILLGKWLRLQSKLCIRVTCDHFASFILHAHGEALSLAMK